MDYGFGEKLKSPSLGRGGSIVVSILAYCSEFESRWLLNFSVIVLNAKTKINNTQAGNCPLKKSLRVEESDTQA